MFIEGENDEVITRKKKKRKYVKRKRDSIDLNSSKKKHKSRKGSIEDSNDNCGEIVTDNVSASADVDDSEKSVNENTISEAGPSSSVGQLHSVFPPPDISNDYDENLASTNDQAIANLPEDPAISNLLGNIEQNQSLPEKSTNLSQECTSKNLQEHAPNIPPVAIVKKEKVGLQPDSDVILNMLEIVDQPAAIAATNQCTSRSQPISNSPSTSEAVLQQRQLNVTAEASNAHGTMLPMEQVIAATGERISENEVLLSIPEINAQDDLTENNAETLSNGAMLNSENLDFMSQNSATSIQNPQEIPIIPTVNTDNTESIAAEVENDSFEEPVSPPHFTLADYKLDPGKITIFIILFCEKTKFIFFKKAEISPLLYLIIFQNICIRKFRSNYFDFIINFSTCFRTP